MEVFNSTKSVGGEIKKNIFLVRLHAGWSVSHSTKLVGGDIKKNSFFGEIVCWGDRGSKFVQISGWRHWKKKHSNTFTSRIMSFFVTFKLVMLIFSIFFIFYQISGWRDEEKKKHSNTFTYCANFFGRYFFLQRILRFFITLKVVCSNVGKNI